jgi:preprotein translocase subunit SecD
MKKRLWMVVLMGAAMGVAGCGDSGEEASQPTEKDVAPVVDGGDTKQESQNEPGDPKRLIKPSGVLNFRIAPVSLLNFVRTESQPTSPVSEADLQLYVKSLAADGPNALRDNGSPYAWFPIHGKQGRYDSMIIQEYEGRRYLLLSNKAGQKLVQKMGQGKWKLSNASVGRDHEGSPSINFEFDHVGASYFSRLTKNNIGQLMAILLNDEVYSAPKIQSMIFSRGQITGKFTLQEAQDLVRTLK